MSASRLKTKFTRRLLDLLDGTRSRTEIFSEMRSFAESEEVIKDEENFTAELSKRLDIILQQLARIGMFSE